MSLKNLYTVWFYFPVLFVLIGIGWVQSSLISRDRQARDLLLERIDLLSLELDDWEQTNLEVKPESLAMGGICAYKSFELRHKHDTRSVNVFVCCGTYRDMIWHRPEHCMSANGLRQVGETKAISIDYGESKAAELGYADFLSDSVGREHRLATYYAFNTGSRWIANTDKRRDFGDSLPYLVKVYVTIPRPLRGSNDADEVDPIVREFISQVDEQLFLTVGDAS